MIKIVLPQGIVDQLVMELKKAGDKEIGGIVMAEHVGFNEFKVCQISVNRNGSFASFVRNIEDALGALRVFFRKTSKNYKRFNYAGEWHSHPNFVPEPSEVDDSSMFDLVQDQISDANFVVLLIVRLDERLELDCTAHTYLPSGHKSRSTVVFSSGL